MDGIDGLAGVEAVSVGIGAAAVSFVVLPQSSVWLLPLLLASAVAGFLVWNLPPARIFMGDVGSGFLGVCLSILALESLSLGAPVFWAWIVLLAVFVADATFTLLRRMVRGRAFYEAHRSHAYQHAARRFGHRAVTLAVAPLARAHCLARGHRQAGRAVGIGSGLLTPACPRGAFPGR
jgi:Fuc2NAc and GlcNAc transferase